MSVDRAASKRRLTGPRVVAALAAIVVLGYLLPERAVIPVRGAGPRDWNARSFWYEPWGASGVHKGIDIFAPRGREVLAAVPGLVIFTGSFGAGGQVVAVLGPRWRIHYYAHLDTIHATRFGLLGRGEVLGTVGATGNAAGKPPHLHYGIRSLWPLPWRATLQSQGWQRMFYIDPNEVLQPR